jgi:hypothetical protein
VTPAITAAAASLHVTGLLAGWPPAERCEFARLIGHFTGDIDRSLDELNL